MYSKEEAYNQIAKLVEKFAYQIDNYKKNYNETQTRQDFINPFFEALGWDMNNKQGAWEAYREVVHEDKLKIGLTTTAPDYSFRLTGGQRLFFVEAKQPSIFIKDDISPAYQVRLYGWNAKLAISVVTDFEEFAIYDCSKKPSRTDKASKARTNYFTYKDYLKEFDFFWNTFSKEQVIKGGLIKFQQSDKKGTTTVDKDFLESLDTWRKELAANIYKNNEGITEDELNYTVQQTIDRIIFLRIAEDRGLEPQNQLKSCLQHPDNYNELYRQFRIADDKYNSGLFHFKKEKDNTKEPDNISGKLIIDNKVIKSIISSLYGSDYLFNVLPVEILGSAYEQFLGKQIIVKGSRATIEEKPEVRKAGGVYYTPQYIVEYIVENTVGKLLNNIEENVVSKALSFTEGLSEVNKLKIVDPACGSGSFLLGAYQYLLNWHIKYYTNNLQTIKQKNAVFTPDGNITTTEKKRILINNIYGVDIDRNAVEVTKLSLLLKCMEGETTASIATQTTMFHERVLPSLENNIKSGNSLIDVDFYDTEFDFGEKKKIKPFNWQQNFPGVFKQGGFDCVIGNPPYVRIHELNEESKNYYREKYKSASNQFDLYQLFYEKGVQLLNKAGLLGFITSNKFCITNYGRNLREILFKTTCIKKIVDCSKTNVFGNVSTYPFIFILSKIYKKGNEVELLEDFISEFKPSAEKLQDELLKGKDEIFTFNNEDNKILLLDKIEKRKVENIFSIYRGRGTSKDLGGGKIKSITNKEIERFCYFNKFFYRSESLYANDFEQKIMMKKICFNLECSVDLTGEINPINTVYVIKPIDDKINILYLLGLLNSILMNFYARHKYQTTSMRGGYIELRVFEVSELPITSCTSSQQKEVISLVNQLLQLNKEKQQTNSADTLDQLQQRIQYTDNKINKLVYALYNLTEEEIKIVEGK